MKHVAYLLIAVCVLCSLSACGGMNTSGPSATPVAFRTPPNAQGVWQGLNGLWYNSAGLEVPNPTTGQIQRN